MSNTELTKFYMGLQRKTEKMQEVVYSDIIPALDKHFDGQWTWELADEKFAQDNTTVCTTVTLYTPGKVYTGRSLCKIKDYASNHLFAILDACGTFIQKNTTSTTTQQPTASQQLQMTPEQILAATSSHPEPEVNTAAQFYNYKDQQGIPGQGVPFNSMTDNCHQELQQEIHNFPMSPSEPVNQSVQSPQNADYDSPQERLKGFSQHQIDRLNQFKKDFDILNDDMFGNYVNTWDKTLTSKKDIIPANVEAFLAWAENLGKMGC